MKWEPINEWAVERGEWRIVCGLVQREQRYVLYRGTRIVQGGFYSAREAKKIAEMKNLNPKKESA